MRNDVMWVKRKFEFNLPLEMFPVVVDRLRGVPPRLEERVRGVSKDVLTRREGEAWSIQEQVGHLMDIELLGLGRLDDYEAGEAVLRPADITNTVTSKADHNGADINELLRTFRMRREAMVGRLERIGVSGAGRSALHPRLNQPMRIVDLVQFIAEHDDHHLAKIAGLLSS